MPISHELNARNFIRVVTAGNHFSQGKFWRREYGSKKIGLSNRELELSEEE